MRVRVRDRSGLRNTRFLLNCDEILATRNKTFRVGVPARNLRPGHYSVKVVAVDAADDADSGSVTSVAASRRLLPALSSA